MIAYMGLCDIDTLSVIKIVILPYMTRCGWKDEQRKGNVLILIEGCIICDNHAGHNHVVK